MSWFGFLATLVFLTAAVGAIQQGRPSDAKFPLGAAGSIVAVHWLGWWLLVVAGVGLAGWGGLLVWGHHLNRKEALTKYDKVMTALGAEIAEGTATEQMLLDAIDRQDAMYRQQGHPLWKEDER